MDKAVTTSETSSRLLQLPAELRVRIYNHVLEDVDTLPLLAWDDIQAVNPYFNQNTWSPKDNVPGILLSCKQLHIEAMATFYDIKDTEICVGNDYCGGCGGYWVTERKSSLGPVEHCSAIKRTRSFFILIELREKHDWAAIFLRLRSLFAALNKTRLKAIQFYVRWLNSGIWLYEMRCLRESGKTIAKASKISDRQDDKDKQIVRDAAAAFEEFLKGFNQ